MDNFKSDDMKKEFEEFMANEPVNPPAGVSEKILSFVKRELNPPATKIFMKLSGIQFVVGFLTLLTCPQFGMGLTSSMGLMKYLMPLGDTVCMFGCGVLFLGSSAFVSALALRPEEVKVLRRTKTLQFLVLGLLSIGVFLCFGAQIVAGLGIAWGIGAILGGITTLELGWVIRKKVVWSD